MSDTKYQSKELQSKSEAELNNALQELRREQFNLRMQRGTGQETKPHQFKLVRKNIARVKTALNSK